MLTLTSGVAECTLHPAIGGSIGSWSIAGQDILRSASAEAVAAADPLGMASFPLVPYSNRIGHARFEWRGRTIELQPNFAPEPHSIQGVGWKTEWTLGECMTESGVLTLHHDGDAHWPWPFVAEQRVVLEGYSLGLSLTARNLADEEAPLAFGHHLYFENAGALLRFQAESVWINDDNSLPTSRVRPAGQYDFSTLATIAECVIDHCYDGIVGTVDIAWSRRTIALEIEMSPSLSAAVVYIPEGGAAFCFEPVANTTNALNRPDMPLMPTIEPGGSFEATVTLRAVPFLIGAARRTPDARASGQE
jgi:aldose 1-epimerase